MTFMYFFFVVTWYVLNVMMAKLWCLPKPQALMRWCSQMWSNTEMRELDAIHIRVSDVSALVLYDCRCTFTLNLMCNLSAEEWRQAYARDQSRQSSGIHSLGFGFLSIPMRTHAMVHNGNLLRCYFYQVPGLLKEDMVLPDSDEDLWAPATVSHQDQFCCNVPVPIRSLNEVWSILITFLESRCWNIT